MTWRPMADPVSNVLLRCDGRLSQPFALHWPKSVEELLDNATARIAGVTLRRITQRFGGDAELRERLLVRDDLPCGVSHAFIMKVGDALAQSSFVAGVVGRNRIIGVTNDACQHATLQLAGNISGDEVPALVEHLRIAGKLTPAF